MCDYRGGCSPRRAGLNTPVSEMAWGVVPPAVVGCLRPPVCSLGVALIGLPRSPPGAVPPSVPVCRETFSRPACGYVRGPAVGSCARTP